MAAYVRFAIGNQGYAIPVQYVIEVLHLVEVKPVPDQPDDHLGVITLRGHVIPVIDLRRRFGGKTLDLSLSTPMIAVKNDTESIVLVVDAVDDVVELEGPFEPYPEPSIESIAHLDDTVVMLPDLNYLMNFKIEH